MTLYLIAHKVRGDPALDVACKMEMSDGPWWIIPTSGHRAYPYWSAPLVDTITHVPLMPNDWPDHYPAAPAKRASVNPAIPKLEDI
jgi:hypothetical protein